MKTRHTVITVALTTLAIAASGDPAVQMGKLAPGKKEAVSNSRLGPFDTEVTRLPKRFMGVDLASLLTALEKHEAPEKSEFETSAEYSARRERWEMRPIAGRLYPDSRIALVVPMTTDSFSYNADAERMSANLTHDVLCGYRQKGLLLASVFKTLGSYVGQNGFGAKTVVTKHHSERLCLVGVDEKKFEFSIPRKMALDARYQSGILIVGTLSKPYLSTSSDYTKPTMDSPRETTSKTTRLNFAPEQYWVFNRTTGEIYLKQVDEVASTLQIVGRDSSPDCDGGARSVGTWVDGTTGAARTIYADGSQWKMKVCISYGTSFVRALDKLTGQNAFEWLENGRRMGNIYRIEDNGTLSIHDNGKFIETMLPVNP